MGDNIVTQYDHITSFILVSVIFLVTMTMMTVMTVTTVMMTTMVIVVLLFVLVTTIVIMAMYMFIVVSMTLRITMITARIGCARAEIKLLDITATLKLGAVSVVTLGVLQWPCMFELVQRRLLVNPFAVVAVKPTRFVFIIWIAVLVKVIFFTAFAAMIVTTTAIILVCNAAVSIVAMRFFTVMSSTTMMTHFVGPESFLASDLHTGLPLGVACVPAHCRCAVTEHVGIMRIFI